MLHDLLQDLSIVGADGAEPLLSPALTVALRPKLTTALQRAARFAISAAEERAARQKAAAIAAVESSHAAMQEGLKASVLREAQKERTAAVERRISNLTRAPVGRCAEMAPETRLDSPRCARDAPRFAETRISQPGLRAGVAGPPQADQASLPSPPPPNRRCGTWSRSRS